MLLDSNALIWVLYRSSALGPETRKHLEAAERVFVSNVSLWELAMKHASGKLAFSPRQLIDDSEAAGIERMDINDHHLLRLNAVSLPHKDPFDRMLINQAHCEGMPLVTSDRHLLASKYATVDSTK